MRVLRCRRRMKGTPRVDLSPRRRKDLQGRPMEKFEYRKKRLVEPGQRVTVWVTSQASGLHYLLPNQRLSGKLGLAMANCIADVRKNRPFRVHVANFGRTPRLISKHITIGYAKQVHGRLAEPQTVFALLLGDETNLKEGAVLAGRHGGTN